MPSFLRPLALMVMAGCAASAAPAVSPAPVPQPTPAPSTAAAPGTGDPRAMLRQFVDSLIAGPDFRSAHWGLLIVDPASGDTLYSRNPDKLFMPASNQKIITGAVALAQLGPDHRWATALLARGPVRDGVLQGDLLVRGEGDPTVSTQMRRGEVLAPLRALADSLRARGVTRVRGRLAAAPTTFTDSPLGYGWAWDDLDEPYGAGVDALYLNEGFTEIVVRGGARAGDPVRAVTRPASTYPALIVRATTAAALSSAATAADSAASRRVRVGYDSSHAGVLVSGTIAAGDSTVVDITYRNHPEAYLAAFREELRARGIVVDGQATDTTARADSLAAILSPTLREVLPYFEKPSQNQIGELLFKTIARRATGIARADSAALVVSRQLVAWGAATDGFVVRDGSGLSRHDYVSPRTLVRVLDAMRTSPSFKIYYDALPVAGVDGTIRNRMRGTPAVGNVHAKTGTIDKARSLSGYVTTADGRLLIFSALCNNYVVPTRRVDAVTDALGVRLASMRLGAR